MHRIGRLTLLATLLLTAAGCSSPAANAKAAATVEIRSFQFAPAVLEVVRGTIVTWTNRDDILHTATAGVATKKDDLGTYERKANGVFDACAMRCIGRGLRSQSTDTPPRYTVYGCKRRHAPRFGWGHRH